MRDKKHSKTEEKDMFSYDDAPDKPKYMRRIYLSLGLGGVTIFSLIILGSIFFTDRATFSKIFAFYCTYSWILPLLYTNIRQYYFTKLIKREQKNGRIFMTFGLYFLFLWVASFVTLLMLLGRLNILWMPNVLFWTSICVFIPYLLFILIVKL